jgi:hypothetical protein
MKVRSSWLSGAPHGGERVKIEKKLALSGFTRKSALYGGASEVKAEITLARGVRAL